MGSTFKSPGPTFCKKTLLKLNTPEPKVGPKSGKNTGWPKKREKHLWAMADFGSIFGWLTKNCCFVLLNYSTLYYWTCLYLPFPLLRYNILLEPGRISLIHKWTGSFHQVEIISIARGKGGSSQSLPGGQLKENQPITHFPTYISLLIISNVSCNKNVCKSVPSLPLLSIHLGWEPPSEKIPVLFL